MCLLICLVRMIEDLVRTLNHNAVIVMSVTGEGYIDSAKSAIAIILGNFPLFYIVDMIGTVVSLLGIIFIVGLPTLIGYLIMNAAK